MSCLPIKLSRALRILISILIIFPASRAAACYVDGASIRLSNHCALDKIKGARVDVRTVQLIDYKLKLDGK